MLDEHSADTTGSSEAEKCGSLPSAWTSVAPSFSGKRRAHQNHAIHFYSCFQNPQSHYSAERMPQYRSVFIKLTMLQDIVALFDIVRLVRFWHRRGLPFIASRLQLFFQRREKIRARASALGVKQHEPLCPRVGDRKINFRALASPDPVSLH